MSDENITPDEDDAYIVGVPNGYVVKYQGERVEMRTEMNDAVGDLVKMMERDNYYPNVWYVNDHGSMTLLLVTFEDAERFTWDFSDVSYV